MGIWHRECCPRQQHLANRKLPALKRPGKGPRRLPDDNDEEAEQNGINDVRIGKQRDHNVVVETGSRTAGAPRARQFVANAIAKATMVTARPAAPTIISVRGGNG